MRPQCPPFVLMPPVFFRISCYKNDRSFCRFGIVEQLKPNKYVTILSGSILLLISKTRRDFFLEAAISIFAVFLEFLVRIGLAHFAIKEFRDFVSHLICISVTWVLLFG